MPAFELCVAITTGEFEICREALALESGVMGTNYWTVY
jgi:hypothetical protein